MSGVPLEIVQRMLRHTDPKITSGAYGHLLMSYQREAISRVRLLSREILSAGGTELQQTAPGAANRIPGADNMLTDDTEGKTRTGTAEEEVLEVPALAMERETGFGPATLSLGS